jgi:hypothetical protein
MRTTLDHATIKTNLCEVLRAIQVKRRLHCPILVDDLVPAEALEKFDSKMWPVALGMLSVVLGVRIPNDASVFKVGRKTQTIDEATSIILGLINRASSHQAG